MPDEPKTEPKTTPEPAKPPESVAAAPEPAAPAPAEDGPKTLDEALALIKDLKTKVDGAGKVPDWAQKRIDQLTANWREEERRTAALKAENEQLKAGKPPAAMNEAEINARAEALARGKAFDAACSKVIGEGRKAIAGFDDAVQRLHNISPVIVRGADGTSKPNMPMPFVEAVIELENAPQVLAELAKPENNDEAARIMGLAPAQQGVALARFASGLKPSVTVSKAPPPPATTVSGSARGEPTIYDDKISMEDFVRIRNEQEAKKRKRA